MVVEENVRETHLETRLVWLDLQRLLNRLNRRWVISALPLYIGQSVIAARASWSIYGQSMLRQIQRFLQPLTLARQKHCKIILGDSLCGFQFDGLTVHPLSCA